MLPAESRFGTIHLTRALCIMSMREDRVRVLRMDEYLRLDLRGGWERVRGDGGTARTRATLRSGIS